MGLIDEMGTISGELLGNSIDPTIPSFQGKGVFQVEVLGHKDQIARITQGYDIERTRQLVALSFGVQDFTMPNLANDAIPNGV